MKQFITSDDVKLAYTDEGDGQPVILIGGYSSSSQLWYKQTEALLGAGYRVIGYNNRFHSHSEDPHYGKRLSRLAKDLQEFIEQHALKDVVLIGQSMGASTIFSYLSLFGDKGLAGFIGIDQTPKMVNTAEWPYGSYGLEMATLGTRFGNPLPSPFHQMPAPDFLVEFQRVVQEEPPFDMEATRPLLLDHTMADWLDVFELVEVPALFIAGRNSPFWPCEHAVEAAKRTPNGTAVIIEECGHPVNWEKPQESNEAILAFLERISQN